MPSASYHLDATGSTSIMSIVCMFSQEVIHNVHPGQPDINIILKLAEEPVCEECGLRDLRFNIILKPKGYSKAVSFGLRYLRFNIILKRYYNHLKYTPRLRGLRFNIILKHCSIISVENGGLRSLRFNIILKLQNKYGRIRKKKTA